jgi:hypothetical protein
LPVGDEIWVNQLRIPLWHFWRLLRDSFRASFDRDPFVGGTDLRIIRALLGHESSRTTEIYAHMVGHHLTKIESPFDRLWEEPGRGLACAG